MVECRMIFIILFRFSGEISDFIFPDGTFLINWPLKSNMMKRDYTEKMHQLQMQGYHFSISDTINEAWAIMKKNIGQFIVLGLISLVVAFGVSLIPVVGSIVSLAVTPALIAGFIIVAWDADRGHQVSINRFFEGFSRLSEFLPVYLLGLLFIFIGFALLIIPGIYLVVCYMLIVPFALFSQPNQQLVQMLENNRKVISKNWFTFFGFVIVIGLLNLAGLILCGIGLLVTLPLTYICFYVLFKRIFGLPDDQDVDVEFNELGSF
jgi:uncharacterized membrane protein